MNLLFDTNIIISIARSTNPVKAVELLNPNAELIYISIASIAEVQSIAFQNNWGSVKLTSLEYIFSNVTVIELTDILVDAYVNIDAFSQRNHPNFQEFPHKTSRNMGKNDLWIAATASLLNLTLVTTDSDFDHLNNYFLQLYKLEPKDLRKYLAN